MATCKGIAALGKELQEIRRHIARLNDDYSKLARDMEHVKVDISWLKRVQNFIATILISSILIGIFLKVI